MSTLIMVSGGFDPLHRGHVELIERASKFGDVAVILNTDAWLTRKKGRPFMDVTEREYILMSMKHVRRVYRQIDVGDSVCDTIRSILKNHPLDSQQMPYRCFLFGNGGDRAKLNTPEVDTCIELGVGLVWGLGAKVQSSSDLIRAATEV
jgi:cytidyltransferase-like protein